MTDANNPYSPPQGPDEPWMPAGPPDEQNPTATASAPKVFGVLSIVFASLVLMFGLMQSCGGLASRAFTNFGSTVAKHEQDAKKAEALRQSMKFMGTIYAGIGIQGLILTLMSGVLLAIGIGQLRYRRWAGPWTLYWCWAAFAAIVAMVAISFLWIGPAYEDMLTTMTRSTPTGTMPSSFGSSMGAIMGGTTGVMTVIFYAPYPIIMAIYFSKERIRSALVR